jgi:hypothetical protein
MFGELRLQLGGTTHEDDLDTACGGFNGTCNCLGRGVVTPHRVESDPGQAQLASTTSRPL